MHNIYMVPTYQIYDAFYLLSKLIQLSPYHPNLTSTPYGWSKMFNHRIFEQLLKT